MYVLVTLPWCDNNCWDTVCQNNDVVMRHAVLEGCTSFDHPVLFNMHRNISTRASGISDPSKCDRLKPVRFVSAAVYCALYCHSGSDVMMYHSHELLHYTLHQRKPHFLVED